MSDDPQRMPDVVRAAANKRIELKEAMSAVEVAAAAPGGDPGWHDKLRQELDELHAALDQHVIEVEQEGGLLAELVEVAPRLSNHVEQVKNEHPMLCKQTADAEAMVEAAAPVEAVRVAVLELLVAVANHRQKGADLVYEGYNVDIGGS